MTQVRLIDANALKESIRKRLCIKSLDYLTEQEKVIVSEIDNAPTVPQVTVCCENASKEELAFFQKHLENVLKRPQGEWIDVGDDFVFKKCSNCGEEAEWLDGGSQFLSKFCPYCGAKMKGC